MRNKRRTVNGNELNEAEDEEGRERGKRMAEVKRKRVELRSRMSLGLA